MRFSNRLFQRLRPAVFALVLSGCPEQIGDRCGAGLPPCSDGFSCIDGRCARSAADAGLTTDAGLNSDGGTAVACDGGCAPWAVCLGTTAETACVNGRVELTAPADGDVYPASTTVTVAARFVLPDAGLWPSTLAIPVQASWGAQTTLVSGVAGALAGLADAGSGVVTIGWDGGPFERRTVSFSACVAEVAVACEAWQECAPTAAGGSCVSQGLVVEWVSPDAGTATNQPSIFGALRVSKPDAGPVNLTTVPLLGVAPFVGSSGQYTGSLPITAPDGEKRFVAGWPDGGPSATLLIERDTVAPSVTVVVQNRTGPEPDPVQPSAWRKDEKALIWVTVDGGRPAVPSDVRPAPGGLVTSEVCAGCTGLCRCFGIDSSSIPLNGLRGPVGLQVLPIEDLAGNATPLRDAGFDLTRFRWSRSVSLALISTEVFAPALSPSGIVVLAVNSRAFGLPVVHAFDPAGNRVWSAVADESVMSPVVVANDSVWVSVSAGPNGRFLELSISDGGTESNRCLGLGAYSALALVRLDGGTEFPVGAGSALALGSVACPLGVLNVPAATAVSLAIRQQNSSSADVFAGAGFDLKRARTSGQTWLDMGTRSEATLNNYRGAFMDYGGNVGLAGGSPPFGAATYLVSASDHLDGGTKTDQPSMVSPPVASADAVYGVAASGLLMRIPFGARGLADAGTEGGPGLATVEQQLVLGGAGHLFTAGTVSSMAGTSKNIRIGQVRTADLATEWSAELASGQMTTSQVPSPALDVYRLPNGTKDCTRTLGVLYIATALGSTATLYSILVDSNGLDPTAPWPKFQRDNANRANISLPTDAWTCP